MGIVCARGGRICKQSAVSSVSRCSSRSVLTAWTLHSNERCELEVLECKRTEAVGYGDAAVANGPGRASANNTVEHILNLVLQAHSGVCAIVAPDEQLRRLVGHAHCSDEGGMTHYMKGLHVSNPEFEKRFLEFTEHTDTDRWPDDHSEPSLRGKPKDGIAVLLSPSGYRVKCAVRLEGLPLSSKTWSQRGMRHMTALAVADFLVQSMVIVRSCVGQVHVLVKEPAQELIAFRIAGGEPAGMMLSARRKLTKSASLFSASIRSVSSSPPSPSLGPVLGPKHDDFL